MRSIRGLKSGVSVGAEPAPAAMPARAGEMTRCDGKVMIVKSAGMFWFFVAGFAVYVTALVCLLVTGQHDRLTMSLYLACGVIGFPLAFYGSSIVLEIDSNDIVVRRFFGLSGSRRMSLAQLSEVRIKPDRTKGLERVILKFTDGQSVALHSYQAPFRKAVVFPRETCPGGFAAAIMEGRWKL